MWTVPLTEFQQEYLRNCSHRWNVKTGATRSGKTYLDCAVTIPKRICASRGEGLLVLMGNTLGTLERNVLSLMRELWGPDLVGVIRTSAAGNVVQLFGKKVYVLGADNKKHIARIQGAAFEYVYGDEITTWDEGVFQMLKSRLSCPHSHFDGTCNPESPTHWFKKFLDSDADIYCQAYTIDDNPTLPAQFVADLKKEYTGTVYYNRFILGQWMAANGVIYRLLADSLAAGDGRFFWPVGKPLHPWRVRIGVDFGGNGSKHAFVATAILPAIPAWWGWLPSASTLWRRMPTFWPTDCWSSAWLSLPAGARSNLFSATVRSRPSSTTSGQGSGAASSAGWPTGWRTVPRSASMTASA